MPRHLAVRTAFSIALGAIPGALSRYYLTELSKAIFGQGAAFHGTFVINVTGCFLIAWFLTLNYERVTPLPTEVRLMVVTGFCGAYTTFSTYELETFTQLQKGNLTLAVLYWLGSAIVGMLGIKLGVCLARFQASRHD